jgi:hypothetical protein
MFACVGAGRPHTATEGGRPGADPPGHPEDERLTGRSQDRGPGRLRPTPEPMAARLSPAGGSTSSTSRYLEAASPTLICTSKVVPCGTFGSELAHSRGTRRAVSHRPSRGIADRASQQVAGSPSQHATNRPGSVVASCRCESGQVWQTRCMAGAELKTALHDELRWAREAMVWKLDGLSEYDVRRPLTGTGTNLLGLVKHLAMGESRYLGEVFGRPFAQRLPWWDEGAGVDADKWATAQETRSSILGLYRRVCEHSDATIEALDLDAPGHVPWWPRPEVRLINLVGHVLAETSRHVGQADILREQLDGSTGVGPEADGSTRRDPAWWRSYVAAVEQAARAASRRT